MTEEQNNFVHLQQQLASLQKRQEEFQAEIFRLKEELHKMAVKPDTDKEKEASGVNTLVEKPRAETLRAEPVIAEAKPKPPSPPVKEAVKEIPVSNTPETGMQSNIERFIGENLINKIGIAITVIGVGIGAKYAIDHQLISPVTRIVLGYLVGLGLLFFALRLRKQYFNFSAVLLSGSMAIMYLITYLAYSLYKIYPQPAAFLLMVIFTAITVTAALRYDREIIAIGGMVGAFAIPFLLSEGSENVIVFFSYIAIIDAGILIIAVKKYWKPLYFSAFGFSWLIFFTWFYKSYKPLADASHAFVFLLLFFIIFYLTFLSYKLIRKEKFNVFDILLLLVNSFIFYGAGYVILKDLMPGRNISGLFTVGNALIHAIVSFIIYRNKLADRNLFYLVSGLAVVFLTLAVPVQLNGSWVTLFWICEAAVLIGIGRIRSARFYENMSYALILIAVISLFQDWADRADKIGIGDGLAAFTPILNITLLSSLIFIAAFAFFIWIFFSRRYPSPFPEVTDTKILLDYLFTGLFVLVLYLSFLSEINAAFDWKLAVVKSGVSDSDQTPAAIRDIFSLRRIWVCNYSLIFLALMSAANIWKIKNYPIGFISFWMILLAVLVFLTQGLFQLSELRESFIAGTQTGSLNVARNYILARYISLASLALPLASLFFWMRREKITGFLPIVFSLSFHLALLWVLCSEMLNILDLTQSAHSYKFGLSILSGLYALGLIVLGITGRKRHLRIAAMVLLGATLIKLFFYDITRLDTILKTILFIGLGVLFLMISFLYNKYKVRLFGEESQG